MDEVYQSGQHTIAPSPVEKLAVFDLEILKLLWIEQFSLEGSGGGMTRQQLVEGLKGKVGESGKLIIPVNQKTEDAALRAHLQMITRKTPWTWTPRVVSREAARNRAGGRPSVYSLDEDSIITWPSTAFMLVAIEKVRRIERDVFIQRILADRILNSSTGEVATKDGIERQLVTSTEWGYIDYHNHTVMHASKRLRFELAYLTFVATYLK